LVREVNAKTDLGPTGKGGSGSHYFLCNDNQEYVVKFDLSKQKTIINELVGGSLAGEIKLPAPEVVIVNITKEFFDTATEELKKKKVQVGKHIGITRLPKKTWDFDYWKDDMLKPKTLTNQNDLYGVISFDNWVINTDRNNQGNNMLELLENDQVRYWMVDLGHCFLDNNWTIERLKKEAEQEKLMDVFPYIKERIDTLEDFSTWFKSIEKMEKKKINEIVDSVPPSWPLSKEEKSLLINLIQLRRKYPRNIICSKQEVLGLAN